MREVALVFPHQLFKNAFFIGKKIPIYLIEEHLFFEEVNFHKQKIVFHRASMKAYETYLSQRNEELHYVEASDQRSDVRVLLHDLKKLGVQKINYIDPVDEWLQKRIIQEAEICKLQLQVYPTELFFNTKEENQEIFKGKKRFFQNDFYMKQRKSKGILIDAAKEPIGGKWSFDDENRKPFPKKSKAPITSFLNANAFHREAMEYTEQHFANNLGIIDQHFLYPTTHAEAEAWLEEFLQNRFHDFGAYEDAIVQGEVVLHHSLISPLINVGLLTPSFILQRIIEFAASNNIPLNSTEGLVRQLIGWREFIRAVYEQVGNQERSRNFWKFNRKIPASFYEGNTGIEPIDALIHQLKSTAYCHHIERLMVLGNFMVLCEFDPDEVYRWFMEFFIDAYDWVMVPNVYGMSQFADGGMMATKPYISGSNYLIKMSNYTKGHWQEVWDALFWRFMVRHHDFFVENPRMSMLIKNFDKMDSKRQAALLERADSFLLSIDNQ